MALIDNSKWDYDLGTGAAQELWGWGNGELQYYTDSESNADVSGGHLVSRPAKRITAAATTPPRGW